MYLQNYQAAELYQVANPKYDGNANSYSATYHQGTATLQLYAHHLTAPKAPGETSERHMTELNAFAMRANINTFREGAGGFRCLRDRAKTNRDDSIHHANQIVRRAPAATPSTSFVDSITSLSVLQEDESDTSPDEFDAEKTTAKRTRHTTEKAKRAVMPPTAGSDSTRHLSYEATISQQPRTSAHYVQSNPRSRTSVEDEKSWRQTRPTQKVLDNIYTERGGYQRR